MIQKHVRMVMMICVVSVLMVWATGADAEEQRCNALGANCVCSEPFNTNTFARVGNYWYNPADSTTKQCAMAGTAGTVVEANDNNPPGDLDNSLAIRNDATALSALPAGHQIQWYWSDGLTTDHSLGPAFKIGASQTIADLGSTSYARLAVRWYGYYTPDFQFGGEGNCNNTKIFQAGGMILTVAPGPVTYHSYNFASGWQGFSVDCCAIGPTTSSSGDFGPTTTQHKGKWWRYEYVISNRAGPNTRYQLYLKNVTDNLPERLVLDTGGGYGSNGGANFWNPTPSLTPNSPFTSFWVNWHRGSTSGACGGWHGASHLMVAGWDTNAGQRIGAATEIEGGGDTTPPASPTALQVQ